jgi:hypothetical protein
MVPVAVLGRQEQANVPRRGYIISKSFTGAMLQVDAAWPIIPGLDAWIRMIIFVTDTNLIKYCIGYIKEPSVIFYSAETPAVDIQREFHRIHPYGDGPHVRRTGRERRRSFS